MGREEIRAALKTPAWEASVIPADGAKSVAVTSYANVCLDGCKTDGNHKKDNRMITEFGQ